MMKYTYKMIISYDGTQYEGWQEQPGKRTICGTLLSAFKKVFHSTDCMIIGASRTDSGVHALGQVALVRTDLDIAPQKLRWVWNNALAQDILIRDMHYASKDFHPHYNVEKKVYYYHLFPQRPLPFFSRYGWFNSHQLDEQVLQQSLQLFVGTHNFKAFRSSDDARIHTERTVIAIDCQYIKRYTAYQIQIVGQKFMRHMIRRIVGAAVTVSIKKNNFQPTMISELLLSGNPNHPLKNAPAKGLLLKKIFYENN